MNVAAMSAEPATRRANHRRGEIEGMIGGKRHILCLTLGALAELETAFAADNLAARFSRGTLSSADLIRIIGAGLRGGGNMVSDEDVAMMELDEGVEGAARLVSRLLAATFAGSDARPARSAEAAPQNP